MRAFVLIISMILCRHFFSQMEGDFISIIEWISASPKLQTTPQNGWTTRQTSTWRTLILCKFPAHRDATWRRIAEATTNRYQQPNAIWRILSLELAQKNQILISTYVVRTPCTRTRRGWHQSPGFEAEEQKAQRKRSMSANCDILNTTTTPASPSTPLRQTCRRKNIVEEEKTCECRFGAVETKSHIVSPLAWGLGAYQHS
jgi:hypothetical protein